MAFSYFYLVREDKILVTASQGADEHKLSMAPNLPPAEGHVWHLKKSLFLHKSIHSHSVLTEQEGGMGQKRVSEKEMRVVVTFISRPS